MLRFIGMVIGFGAIYALVSGALLAFNKPVLESSDMMIIGMALMVISQLFIRFGTHADSSLNDTNSNAALSEK